MWIKTAQGQLINLANAFEVNYDASTSTIDVWWSFPLPSNDSVSNSNRLASIYDAERIVKYRVDPDEWLRVVHEETTPVQTVVPLMPWKEA
jgi:hypothetical protein